jgi:hypothetical protein
MKTEQYKKFLEKKKTQNEGLLRRVQNVLSGDTKKSHPNFGHWHKKLVPMPNNEPVKVAALHQHHQDSTDRPLRHTPGDDKSQFVSALAKKHKVSKINGMLHVHGVGTRAMAQGAKKKSMGEEYTLWKEDKRQKLTRIYRDSTPDSTDRDAVDAKALKIKTRGVQNAEKIRQNKRQQKLKKSGMTTGEVGSTGTKTSVYDPTKTTASAARGGHNDIQSRRSAPNVRPMGKKKTTIIGDLVASIRRKREK